MKLKGTSRISGIYCIHECYLELLAGILSLSQKLIASTSCDFPACNIVA